MRIKPFEAVYPNLKMIASPDTFFGTVKYRYREYVESGFFKRISKNSFYVYEIVIDGVVHTGLIAGAATQEYIDGHIKKHENTLAKKEQNMMNLLLHRKAMVKPVLLCHPRITELEQFYKKTKKRKFAFEIKFDDTDEQHKVWQVSSTREIAFLRKLFREKLADAYIADGHHRCSTSKILHEGKKSTKLKLDFSQILCCFFSYDQLDVHDFNRVIEILNEISPTRFMAALSKYCKIEPKVKPFKPKAKHIMSLYINKEWYRLEWKRSVLKKYEKNGVALDAHILDEKILREICRIDDVRTDARITYVEGVKGMEGLEEACVKSDASLAIAMFPVHLDEMTAIADMGMIMPPKSTYFEPRMRNGIIAQEF